VIMTPKLKQLIGKSTPPRPFEIEKGQIRRFAAAIGEENRIHYDEQAARAAGFRSVVSPPTFAAALTPPDLFLEELGWDALSIMHRAEEYEYFRPLCGGDTIYLTYRLSDVYEQPGGGDTSLIFAVLETRGTDAHSRPVFKGRRVLVKRQS
jgi:acyl dehydratase